MHTRIKSVLFLIAVAVITAGTILHFRSVSPFVKPDNAAELTPTPTTPAQVSEKPAAVAAATPFHNSSTYVGSTVCATCHTNQHHSYLQTAHSRAMSVVDPNSEPADHSFFHTKSRRQYAVYREGDQLWHSESAASDLSKNAASTSANISNTPIHSPDDSSGPRVQLPLKYLVGSGRHSRTYLVEQDGFLMESPVTWYTSTRQWSMSPGYDHPGHMGFERAADQGCLICHVGQFTPIDGALNRLDIHETAIGCERCHGPGSEHVTKWKNRASVVAFSPPETLSKPGVTVATVEEADDTIVHPGRLTREMQEAICAQCHLRGDATVLRSGRAVSDFRPGMPLTNIRIDYHLADSDGQMKVVGHVEQMHASRCWQQSADLSCATCHESHLSQPPEAMAGFYRSKCLECHSNADCGISLEEREKQPFSNDCLKCHMPQVSTDIPHIAFTHHRIGIHRGDNSVKSGIAARGKLVPFGELSNLSEAEQARCLGLAYLELSGRRSDPGSAKSYRQEARQLLNSVLNSESADGDVYAALSRLAFEDNQTSVALEYSSKALKSSRITVGERINALLIAANCYLDARDSARAVAPLEELVQLRRNSEDWMLLGIARFQLGLQKPGIESIEHAARIQPFRPDLHATLIRMYQTIGNQSQADRHQQLLNMLSPVPQSR